MELAISTHTERVDDATAEGRPAEPSTLAAEPETGGSLDASECKAEAANAEASYEVGFGKPPRHSQFKRGQSGNPRGRVRRPQMLPDSFGKVLREKLSLPKNGRIRKVPKIEIVLTQLANAAARGDIKAAEILRRYMDMFYRDARLRKEPKQEQEKEQPLGRPVVILPSNGREIMPPELEAAYIRVNREYGAGRLPEQQKAQEQRRRRKAANENQRWDAVSS